MYFFVPKDTSLEMDYNNGFRLDGLIPATTSGLVTANDFLNISFSVDEQRGKIADLLNLQERDWRIKTGRVKDSRDWRYETAKKDAATNVDGVNQIAYRPFDTRFTCYTGKSRGLYSSPQHNVMSHFLNGDNIGLCCIRICSRDDDLPVFVTDKITDKTILSSKDNANVFPLYLYQDTLGNVEKVANFDKDVFGRIADGLKRKPSPEEIFDYIYAVLHTPEYRERYREFLKVDFPRIPYPTNAAVFKKLAKIGGELRETHLLKAKPTASERNRIANFPKGGGNAVEDVRFANGKVYINDEQYFDHVPEEAWGMFIGGYQPAQKWLKDRKGRVLSNEDTDHYQEIVFALVRTRALMQKLSALSKEWLG
jgi:predicted helicase